MKNRLLLFLSGFFILTSVKVHGQLAMTRTTFTGSFTPITSGGGGGILSTATGDDNTQDGLPIGFSFNYLGTNYTTMSVSTNGWASFNAALGSAQNANTNLYSTTGPQLSIGPWWDDLASDSIVYRTTGSLGSQVFTIQWNSSSFYTASTTKIQFQLKLYEGTNIIEFHYGTVTPGTVSTSESASIGIEGATGGVGNYLDAVTGSAFVGQYYMQAATKWPVRYYRFTPGAPAPVAGGAYTVGMGQTYPTIDEAVADLNHRGITGPIVLNLTQATYDVTPANGDNIFPIIFGPINGSSSTNTVLMQPVSGTSTLTYEGVTSGGIANASTTTAAGTGNEPIIALVGARYVGISNINLTCSSTGVVDRGIAMINQSAAGTGSPNFGGTQNCGVQNVNVTLSRINTTSMGFETRIATAPTAATGANSNNYFLNYNISNTYLGITLSGNSSFPDIGNILSNSVPTNYNTIGSATPNDIGNGTATTYGIQCLNQSNVTVSNNIIQNITVTGAVAVDGIFMNLTQGTSLVFNNKIMNIRSTNTTSTSNINGIRANVAASAGHNLRVYNNFISGLTSGYTGVATATRVIRGIFAQAAGGGVTTSSINIDHNSVSIDGSSSPNLSSTCYEAGTTLGPIINVRNNSFANFTGAQTAPALHLAYHSTSATLTGNTGSISNYNNLYVSNATQGFVGQGNTTTYANLGNWQAGMVGQDANSISGDPGYTNALTDLHASGITLNNLGTPIAWVTGDIDNEVRNGTTPDIGADEYTPLTLDMGVTALVSPSNTGCFSATQPVEVTIRNFGVATINFAVNPVVVNVNITGALTTNLNTTINSGTLAPSATLNTVVGSINMLAAGTYTFNANTTIPSGPDQNSANDAMTAVNRTVNYGVANSSVPGVCELSGDSTALTITSLSAGFTYQWQVSTNNGSTWNNLPGGTISPFYHTPNDTSIYRAEVCGGNGYSILDTTMFSAVTLPTIALGDTVCGVDSLHFTASGSGNIYWYADSTSSGFLAQGNNYSVLWPATDTVWVSNTSGSGTQNVGKVDNSGGGGQQTSTAYNIFDAFSPFTLIGVTAYPGAAGNVVFQLQNSSGATLQTVTYPVSAGDVNNPTFIPLNLNITPGTGYRLAQGPGSVSMFRSNGGVTYPYTVPGVVSITGSSAGATFYYFGYNWLISTGCESGRLPVVGVVNTAPTISATAGSTTICEMDTTTLTVTSVDTTYSYSWSNGATLSNPTLATTNAYPSIPTTYIVQANNPVGCITYDTVSIQVNPAPIGTLSITDTIICIGDSAGIQFNTPGGIFTDSTALSILDNTTTNDTMLVTGQVSSMTISSIDSVCLNGVHSWVSDVTLTLIAPNGTQMVLVSGEGGGGDNFTNVCFSPTAVNPIAGAVAPFTGTWIPEGVGGFSVFNGANANGNWILRANDNVSSDQGTINNWTIWFNERAYTYSWSSSTAGALSDTTDSISVNPIVTTVYTLNVTDSVTGCSKSFPITLQVRDSLDFTVTGIMDICPGDSTQWFVTPSGGDGNYSYLWSDGLGTNDTTAIFTIPFDYTFGLTITDGCNSPAFTDSVSINIFDNNIQVTVVDTTICFGTDLDLPSTVTGGGGVYSYTWNPGATNNDSLLLTNVTTPASYTLSVTDQCGFTGNDVASISIDPLPVAGFTVSGSVASFNFTNTSTNATTYSWNFGDSQTSTATNPSHTYTSSGLFTVTLIATNNCGADTITSSVTSTLGIEESMLGTISVYPNPTADYINLSVLNSIDSELLVQLFDLTGKLILNQIYPVSGGELVTSFDLSTIASGIYDLKVTGANGSANYRIVRK